MLFFEYGKQKHDGGKTVKTTNEKKLIAPNECSTRRWIVALVIGVVLGIVGSTPMATLLENRTDTIMGITYADFFGVLSFVPLFIGIVIALRLVCKTSLKDFILGVGGKVDKKGCLIMLGLYVVGFAIPLLITAKNISLRDVDPAQFAFLFFFMLLTVWMQTSFEELVFRGVLGRWACKNNLTYTKKAIIAAVISSLLFAIAHSTNPEVTSQSGIWVVVAVLVYAIPGLVYFWANMHFGSLLPGLVIHWINNFLLMTVIGSAKDAVVSTPTLFVDATGSHASWSLISTVLVHLPIVLYLIIDMIRKKKKAAKEQ